MPDDLPSLVDTTGRCVGCTGHVDGNEDAAGKDRGPKSPLTKLTSSASAARPNQRQKPQSLSILLDGSVLAPQCSAAAWCPSHRIRARLSDGVLRYRLQNG